MNAATEDIDEVPLREFVAEAARQGVRFEDDTLAAFVEALISAEECYEGQLAAAIILLDLPIVASDVPRALTFLDDFPSSARVATRAISVNSWSRDDPQVGRDLSLMADMDPSTRIVPDSGNRWASLGPDPLYRRGILAVADNLDKAGEHEVAERLAERINRGLDIVSGRRIRSRLIAHGFRELADAADAEFAQAGTFDFMRETFAEQREIEDSLLSLLSDVGPAIDLNQIQRRRLDDLADLVTTSDFGKTSTREISAGLRDDRPRLSAVLRAATLLSGRQLEVVASEAREVREEIVQESGKLAVFAMLWDEGHKLQFDNWSRIPDPVQTASAVADAIFSRYPWIADLALLCLEHAPRDALKSALAILNGGLGQVRGRVQCFVGLSLLALSRDIEMLRRFERDDRAMLRRAAATYRGWLPVQADTREGLLRLLGDADRGVREDAISAIASLDLSEEFQTEVTTSREQPLGWECVSCATSNGADRDRCERCNMNGPKLAPVESSPS